MVDGHSQRSFDIHRSDLTVVNNQTHQQIVDDHLRAMATPRETSQGNDGEDDTLQASICHSKMLLQNQSLDVNEEGRTILRTTSEGSGVTVRKDVCVHVLCKSVNFFVSAIILRFDVPLDTVMAFIVIVWSQSVKV